MFMDAYKLESFCFANTKFQFLQFYFLVDWDIMCYGFFTATLPKSSVNQVRNPTP